MTFTWLFFAGSYDSQIHITPKALGLRTNYFPSLENQKTPICCCVKHLIPAVKPQKKSEFH